MRKQKKVLIRTIALCASLALLAGSLAGCGKKPSQANKPGSEASQDAGALVFGTKSASAKSIEVTNKTSRAIAKLDLKGSEETTWTQHPAATRPWKDGEKATIYYTEPAAAAPAKAPADGDQVAVALQPQLDVQLTFEDGKTSVLHAIQLDGLTDGSFGFDATSGLAYLSYTESGQTYSTLDAEKALQAKAEAAQKTNPNKASTAEKAKVDKLMADRKAAMEKAAANRASALKKAAKKKNNDPRKVKQQGDQCIGDLLLK
ncbi:MAG: hypothetical protein FWD65_01490 [Coriobacteriia bacterium]|nr:hypothetical protein [Coriobacteriia bacterium]